MSHRTIPGHGLLPDLPPVQTHAQRPPFRGQETRHLRVVGAHEDRRPFRPVENHRR